MTRKRLSSPFAPEDSSDSARPGCLDRRTFLKKALAGALVWAAPVLGGATAASSAAEPGCGAGRPDSFTAAAPGRLGQCVLFSDVHFDPFADPSKAKALAAAPAHAWREILAGATPGARAYGQDTDDALFQGFLDDLASRAPRPDFLLFPGDLLSHRFWTVYPRLTGDTTQDGLLAFIGKTAEYFFTEVTRRFPDSPVYPAVGNNDSLEGDFRLVPDSPYLAVTAPCIARLALKEATARAAFLARYPHDGCYALPLPGLAKARLVVVNDIFGSKRYPTPAYGRPVLDFLERELTQAGQRGERVWLLTHVAPGDNAKASAKFFLKTGTLRYAPWLTEAWDEALTRLLTRHAGTVKAAFAGHLHRDAFRLFSPETGMPPVGMMRLAPAISPITGNNPGYQLYTYDRESLELLDARTVYRDSGAPRPAWDVEYVYSETYGRGLRTPGDWQAMYRELLTCPARAQAFAAAFALGSRRVREVTPETFPVYWRSLGRLGQAAFTAGEEA